jgi:hypothetical protein
MDAWLLADGMEMTLSAFAGAFGGDKSGWLLLWELARPKAPGGCCFTTMGSSLAFFGSSLAASMPGSE